MRYEHHAPTKLMILSVGVIIAGAIAIMLAGAKQLLVAEHAWLMMIALSLFIAPMSAINLPGSKARLALGHVVTFACAALFGLSAGILVAVADGVLTSLRITRNPSKILYNIATCVLATAGAGLTTKAAFPQFGAATTQFPPVELVGALGLFALCYFIIATSLVAGYLAVAQRQAFLTLWREDFLWISLSYLASGLSAVTACLLVGRFGYYIFLGLMAVMLVIFLFYRSYFQKVEKANQRADQLAGLNFQTIETFISALSAAGYAVKMNVRRVEHLALALGQTAGCAQDELAALKLAVRLHDIGNVAVPPGILEKPGPLTPEEYAMVKVHAEVGATMVETMDLPYPVAEIVRYHHERFDGTGYPSGLKDREIPLAARVLAIVDCYNALTIDRPFRSRLSRKDALVIMIAESGKAFDPELLTEFLELVQPADEAACQAQARVIKLEDLQAELLTRREYWQTA